MHEIWIARQKIVRRGNKNVRHSHFNSTISIHIMYRLTHTAFMSLPLVLIAICTHMWSNNKLVCVHTPQSEALSNREGSQGKRLGRYCIAWRQVHCQIARCVHRAGGAYTITCHRQPELLIWPKHFAAWSVRDFFGNRYSFSLYHFETRLSYFINKTVFLIRSMQTIWYYAHTNRSQCDCEYL